MTLKPRRALVWMAAVLGIVVTVSAGIWQMDRAGQKRAAQTALMQQRALAPWTPADWPCEPAVSTSRDAAGAMQSALPLQRQVVLRGHWIADRTVFLDNRPMGAASGFIVVTPLRLSSVDTHCPHAIVLVQRGWVPRDVRDRQHLPDVITPAGEVTIHGRVMASVSQVFQLGVEAAPQRVTGPLIRQNADAAFWTAWLGQSPLAGAALQVQAAEPVDADVLQRHWPQAGSGQDKHLAYAAQWFAMAALIAGLTLWFQVIAPRRSSRS
ncbi:MAG: SURF1 family protein [Aquabacterium sp.]